MNNVKAFLTLEHLNKTYPDGRVQALVDVSLAIQANEYVAIMGPSGSGKSTLLNMIGALDKPDSGKLFFNGQDYSQFKDLDTLRASKIGIVFQSFYLLPNLSAFENVQIPMFESPLTAQERSKKAEILLEAVGMSHRKNHLPSHLSVGEKQRVAIARSLANNPQLLLADEPTGSLDSRSASDVLELFDTLRRDLGMALLVVTHDQKVAARADRIIRIADGTIQE